MCFMNCRYESYPNGPNEGCHCRLPMWETCPYDREEEDNAESYEDEGEDEDEYMPRRRLDGEEKYWPEWAFRRV